MLQRTLLYRGFDLGLDAVMAGNGLERKKILELRALNARISALSLKV
jgi:hypothetical protein